MEGSNHSCCPKRVAFSSFPPRQGRSLCGVTLTLCYSTVHGRDHGLTPPSRVTTPLRFWMGAKRFVLDFLSFAGRNPVEVVAWRVDGPGSLAPRNPGYSGAIPLGFFRPANDRAEENCYSDRQADVLIRRCVPCEVCGLDEGVTLCLLYEPSTKSNLFKP